MLSPEVCLSAHEGVSYRNCHRRPFPAYDIGRARNWSPRMENTATLPFNVELFFFFAFPCQYKVGCRHMESPVLEIVSRVV